VRRNFQNHQCWESFFFRPAEQAGLSLLRLGSEQSQFSELRKGGVAVIGRDIKPVAAIDGRTRDRIAFEFEASDEWRIGRLPYGQSGFPYAINKFS
jgi:hypothetical protein